MSDAVRSTGRRSFDPGYCYPNEESWRRIGHNHQKYGENLSKLFPRPPCPDCGRERNGHEKGCVRWGTKMCEECRQWECVCKPLPKAKS